MKIVVNPFDTKSIDNALAMIEQYKKDFVQKEELFCRRLAELGVQLARDTYFAADYDGTKDVAVTLVKTEKGYSVVAYGETVGFLEFGTGIRNREWGGSHLGYTPPPHGSYGKGQGKNPWGWWFTPQEGAKAVHTYGNPPAEAMLTARDNMVQRITQIAREVWR